jgi:Holliday junction resolvasome RuvABC DNA-binding subunit
MIEPKEILIKAIEEAMKEGMTNAQLSRASGVNNSVISRLLSRERDDIRSGDFFKLVYSLPPQIRSETLVKLGLPRFDIAEMVANSTTEEKARVLEAISHSLRNSSPKQKAVA